MDRAGDNLVFVYGILKTPEHADNPPETVRGVMYSRGIALARFDEDGIVRGEVRAVDDATLADWDRIEGVAHGMYSRVRVTTDSGIKCWAYQYEQSLHGASIIEDGVWGRERRW